MKPDAVIWCDGACSKGVGGCAAILVANGKTKIVTDGHIYPTTNQRMELLAAIIGLNGLWWRSDRKIQDRIRRKKRVVVYSDSAYLVNCFRDGWIQKWRRNNWKKVKNREYWETLEALVKGYKEVEFVHVKGHAGIGLNEEADKHANLARVSYAVRSARLKDQPEFVAREEKNFALYLTRLAVSSGVKAADKPRQSKLGRKRRSLVRTS